MYSDIQLKNPHSRCKASLRGFPLDPEKESND